MRPRWWLGAGAAVASARAFSLICAAVQVPLLTATLAPAEYSVIAVAIAIATYFSLVSAEPTILGFERFPGDDADRSNYRYAIRRVLLALAVAAALAVVAGAITGQVLLALGVAGWAVGISVNRIVSIAWLMWGKPWQYSGNLMASTGARTVGLVGLVAVGVDPLLSLASAGVLSAIAGLIFRPRSRGITAPRPWPAPFGLQLAVAALAFTVLTNGSLIALPLFLEDARVGAFAVMLQVATLTSAAILNLILSVAYPRLRAAWDDGGQGSVRRSISDFQLVSLAVALAAVVVSHVGDFFLLRLIFPEDFINATVLAPLIISTAISTNGSLASWQHQLQLDGRTVAIRTVIAGGVAGALALTLSAVWSEPGAALATLIGFFVYLVLLQRGAGLPPGNLIWSAVVVVAGCLPLGLPGLGSTWEAAICVFLLLGLGLHWLYRHRLGNTGSPG